MLQCNQRLLWVGKAFLWGLFWAAKPCLDTQRRKRGTDVPDISLGAGGTAVKGQTKGPLPVFPTGGPQSGCGRTP